MKTTWADMLEPVPVLAAANLLILSGLAAVVGGWQIYPIAFLIVMGAFQVGRITAERES